MTLLYRTLHLCIFLFLFSPILHSTEMTLPPKITLKIPQEERIAGIEIPLYITIIHSPSQIIDTNRFLLNEKNLHVDAIQKERIAPPELFDSTDQDVLILSHFRTTLPARDPGVYTIGPVTVFVNDHPYLSETITINIQEAIKSDHFRLETKINKPHKIFLGAEIRFEYRIYFARPMKILRENLSLLNVDGFRNRGSPTVKIEQHGEEYVETIIQEATAIKPGTYHIPGSVIDGIHVEQNGQEQRLIPPLLRAETEPLTLTIFPFPEKEKPPIFRGALGSFVWRTSILGKSEVPFGESVQIKYRVSGRGALSTVLFPSFTELKGLSDAFWTDPSPPIGKEQQGTKEFLLTLKPKHPGTLEIPGFTFSSFDPISERYITRSVPSILITVTGKSKDTVSREHLILAAPFDLTPRNISAKTIAPSTIGIFIILCITAAIGEAYLSKKILQQEEIVSSRSLFYQAMKLRSQGNQGLLALKKALYLRLYELNLTQQLEETPSSIQGEGIVMETKELLEAIDQCLYQHKNTSDAIQEIYDEAIILYHRFKQIEHKE